MVGSRICILICSLQGMAPSSCSSVGLQGAICDPGTFRKATLRGHMELAAPALGYMAPRPSHEVAASRKDQLHKHTPWPFGKSAVPEQPASSSSRHGLESLLRDRPFAPTLHPPVHRGLPSLMSPTCSPDPGSSLGDGKGHSPMCDLDSMQYAFFFSML
jgi:hypothetical protein